MTRREEAQGTTPTIGVGEAHLNCEQTPYYNTKCSGKHLLRSSVPHSAPAQINGLHARLYWRRLFGQCISRPGLLRLPNAARATAFFPAWAHRGRGIKTSRASHCLRRMCAQKSGPANQSDHFDWRQSLSRLSHQHKIIAAVPPKKVPPLLVCPLNRFCEYCFRAAICYG